MWEDSEPYPFRDLQVGEAFLIQREHEGTIPKMTTMRCYASGGHPGAQYSVFHAPNSHDIIVKRVR